MAYIDDSGDPGTASSSPTDYLVLAATLVRDREWLACLDGLVELRRRLYSRYGIPPRDILKARDFLRGGGVFRSLDLAPRSRIRILKGIYRFQAQELPLRVFAVAIHKASAQQRGWEPSQAAWTFLLQRLQRLSEEQDEMAMLLTEPSLSPAARRLVRHMRRHHRVPFHHGEGERRFDIRRVVEDPLHATDNGYWLQLADWNAYAALRSRHVAPRSPKLEGLWDLLGDLRVGEVSKLKRGPSGLVIYP